MKKFFDVDFINPKGHPGTVYEFEADTPEQAMEDVPYALSVNSPWRPDQFRVMAVRPAANPVYSEEQS